MSPANKLQKYAILLALTTFLISSTVAQQQIDNCEQLQSIEPGNNYELTQDIDCSSIDNFEPLTDYSAQVEESDGFTGTLNGNGYEIRNLNIERPDQTFVGLFTGIEEGAEIKNLGIVDSEITGGTQTGAFVGRQGSDTTVNSSYFRGEVNGKDLVGGISGWHRGTITETYVHGNITGDQGVGGIAGRNFAATITGSYVKGNIEGESNVGGITGKHYGVNSYVTFTYFSGDVSGEPAGGIIGAADGGGERTVGDSYWNQQPIEQQQLKETGQPLSTSEMTGENAQENMNLDFDTKWSVSENGNLPYLRDIQTEGFEVQQQEQQQITGIEFSRPEDVAEDSVVVSGETTFTENDNLALQVGEEIISTSQIEDGSFSITTRTRFITADAENPVKITIYDTLENQEKLQEKQIENVEQRIQNIEDQESGEETEHIVQEIDLVGESWNNIAVNIKEVSLSDSQGDCELSPYETSGISGYAWTVADGSWKALPRDQNLSTTKGYSVYASQDCTLRFEGQRAEINGVREVSGGMWNLITLPPETSPADLQSAVQSRGETLMAWENEIFWTNLGTGWTHPRGQLNNNRSVYVYPSESLTLTVTSVEEDPGVQ